MERKEFERGHERPHRDRGRHERKREDFRRDSEEHRVHRRPHHKKKMTTKLFTDKVEMIEYVNVLGEQGHHIDIFKIEDGLYKVVVIERRHKQEIDIEVEV